MQLGLNGLSSAGLQPSPAAPAFGLDGQNLPTIEVQSPAPSAPAPADTTQGAADPSPGQTPAGQTAPATPSPQPNTAASQPPAAAPAPPTSTLNSPAVQLGLNDTSGAGLQPSPSPSPTAPAFGLDGQNLPNSAGQQAPASPAQPDASAPAPQAPGSDPLQPGPASASPPPGSGAASPSASEVGPSIRLGPMSLPGLSTDNAPTWSANPPASPGAAMPDLSGADPSAGSGFGAAAPAPGSAPGTQPNTVVCILRAPALFGLLSTVQGTATLQYAPGGSPNSASLVDGQGNVQGALQAGQITLTNPAALTFNPPGTPANVAPAPAASTGTPSPGSLAGAPVRLGDTAAMTMPDAGTILATPGFTPAPPMPPLPGYSPPNLNLPPLTGTPIPDQPTMPISKGSPLPDVNLGNWQEAFPISDPVVPNVVMATSPNSTMRANANATGTYVDPISNQVVPSNTTLAADHIYPQSAIKQLPGFDQLSQADQSSLLNDSINTQGLPQTYNSSKGAQLPGQWQTYKGQPLDPNYVMNDAIRADALRQYFINKIASLNGSKTP